MFGKSGLKGVPLADDAFSCAIPPFCLPLRQIVKEEVAEWLRFVHELWRWFNFSS